MTQLTLFENRSSVPDSKRLSGTPLENKPFVETYYPAKRATSYYRLVVRQGKKLKKWHIRGGSTSAKLANYRATRLQEMIDRGAPLAEIIAQVTDWR